MPVIMFHVHFTPTVLFKEIEKYNWKDVYSQRWIVYFLIRFNHHLIQFLLTLVIFHESFLISGITKIMKLKLLHLKTVQMISNIQVVISTKWHHPWVFLILWLLHAGSHTEMTITVLIACEFKTSLYIENLRRCRF